jgi:RHS repeat-associated protein
VGDVAIRASFDECFFGVERQLLRVVARSAVRDETTLEEQYMCRNLRIAIGSLVLLLFASGESRADNRANVVKYCYTDSANVEQCSTDLGTVETAMRADHVLGERLERCPEDDPRTGGEKGLWYCVPDVASAYAETRFQVDDGASSKSIDSASGNDCPDSVWPIGGCPTEEGLFIDDPVCTRSFFGSYAESPNWDAGIELTIDAPEGPFSAWASEFAWPDSDRQFELLCPEGVAESDGLKKLEIFECPAKYTASGMSGGSMGLYQDYEHGQPIYPPICRAPTAQIRTLWSNREPRSNCPGEGNPCIPGTGEKVQVERDFVWWDIPFERTYNSAPKRDVDSSAGMGAHWSTSWSAMIDFGPIIPGPGGLFPDAVWLLDERGQIDRYERSGTSSTYLPKLGRGQILQWQLFSARLHRSANEILQFGSGGVPSVERVDNPLRSVRVDQTLQIPGQVRVVAGNGHFLTFHSRRIGGSVGGGTIYTYDVVDRIVDDANVTLVTYGYDARGNLTQATYADGKSRIYHYAEIDHVCVVEDGSSTACDSVLNASLLTGITDERGVRYAHYYYYADGRAARSVHAGGADDTKLSYIQESPMPTTEVVRSGGAKVRYEFELDELRRPVTVTRLEGDTPIGATNYAYAPDGSSETRTDANGRLVKTQYDLLQRETKRTEALGTADERVTTTVWSEDFPLSPVLRDVEYPTSGRRLPERQSWAYNARGQVSAYCVGYAASYTCNAGTTLAPATVARTLYTYCEGVSATCPATGALLRVDGPRVDINDWTSFVYADGALSLITNALGQTRSLSGYDSGGRPQRIVDFDGVGFTIVYNARGWISSVARDGGAVTTYDYNHAGDLTKITPPGGNALTFVYDLARRLTEIRDVAGGTIRYTLDASGNRLTEVVGIGDPLVLHKSLTREFDMFDRLRIARDAYGAITTQFLPGGYDANDNALSWSDARGASTTQTFDALDRIATTSKGGASTSLRYDAADRITSVKDPDNVVTTYAYDGSGARLRETNPDRPTTYARDRAGNATSATDGRGVSSTFTYDARNRLTHIARGSGVPGTTLRYDTYATSSCNTSSAQGQLTEVGNGSAALTFCYDAVGNIVRKRQAVPGVATHELGITYDSADRITSMTYPSGVRIAYTYNVTGRQRTATLHRPSVSMTSLVSETAYLPFGPLTSLTYGNGRQLDKQYDRNYAIVAISDGKADGLDISFDVNARGEIVGIEEARPGLPMQPVQYEYDSLGRLADETLLNLPADNRSYNYSAGGDRVEKVVNGVTESYAYTAGSHRLRSVGAKARTYDGAGNTLRVDTADPSSPVFSYDATNRMSGVTVAGATTQYRYNGLGERIVRTRPGASAVETTVYLYDVAGRLIGEYRIDAGVSVPVVEYFYFDGAPVAVMNNGQLSYVETDHLGTPRLLVDPATDAWQWRWSLTGDAFGGHAPQLPVAGGVSFNLRFPGQYFDSETALHYNYFRDYEPGAGRYVQSDPLGIAAGTNTYAYVGSGPMGATDPLGLMTICIGGKKKTDFSGYPAYLQLAASYIMQSDSLEDAAHLAHRVYIEMNAEYKKVGVWTQTLEDHRNAEHYMFVLDWTDRLPGAAHLSLALVVPGYSFLKLFGDEPEDSPPSLEEISAGYMGISDSLSLLPGGNLKFTNGNCDCD